ncbi:MAG: hypothetical protein AUK47_25350 [Deltaproteobacteria bacterium CG2_30_63_29]|nr:MAG: hypothetical protein AUK47_25350 [Deltaproteobacteria bacterium CG2_30_63_29]
MEVVSWSRPSGAAFVLVERAGDVVTIDLAIRSGSADDPPDRAGLARLSAELLLFGHEGLSKLELEDRLADLGAVLMVDVDQTLTMVTIEVLPRSLDGALELLAELLQSHGVDVERLNRTRRELVAQIELDRENDSLTARKKFASFVYQGHPYGKSIEGTASSLKAIKPSDVERFRETHYVQANFILSVSGGVTRSQLDEALAKHLPEDESEAPARAHREMPPRDGRRVLLIDKPDRTQNQLFVGQTSIPPSDPRWPELRVLSTILGGNFSSRLNRELRDEKGWTYSISTREWRDPDVSAFFVWTFTAPDRAVESIRIILEHLERIVAQGVSTEEVAAAREYVAANYELYLDTPSGLAREAVRMLHTGREPAAIEEFKRKVRALTADDVNKAAPELLHPDQVAIVMMCSAEHFSQEFLDLPGLSSVVIASYDEE